MVDFDPGHSAPVPPKIDVHGPDGSSQVALPGSASLITQDTGIYIHFLYREWAQRVLISVSKIWRP